MVKARQGKPRLLQAMEDAFSLPDLRRRLLFTVGILVAFRFIAHVPLAAVNFASMDRFFEGNQLFGMLDLFSGGAMRNFSVVAMGVYPYITSSIIMQLLVPVIPSLQALAQEGEAGRNRINQITHWITVPLAALQGYAQLALLRSQDVLASTSGMGTAAMIVSMVAGTMFLIWLGEFITERGIGNGISLIIFAGIVAGLPEMAGRSFLARENLLGLLVFIVLGLATMVVIVLFTEGHRRIPVQYARSVIRGGRVYRQSGSSYIPLRVNTAGMIPLIFAIAVVTFPYTIASYFARAPGEPGNFANTMMHVFSPDAALPLGLVYWVMYFVLVGAFAFFYTMVIFEQMQLPKTLQRQGGFVPGIRPGKNTDAYLKRVISHITWGGAIFLATVAILPFLARAITDVRVLTLSSTGLLIVVGVALDTMKQIEAQLAMRRYEGFLK
ncbi:MAG: preprotein translocase subunit SecY [Chloroflexota bacterium]